MALQIGISIDEGTGLVTQGPAGLLGKSILATDGDGSALTGLTKSQVGLGSVDNTSDATKNAAVATLTNKDLTSSTNTYRAATTSQAGAVELATKNEELDSSSESLVSTPSGRVWALHHGLYVANWNNLEGTSVSGTGAVITTGGNAGPTTGGDGGKLRGGKIPYLRRSWVFLYKRRFFQASALIDQNNERQRPGASSGRNLSGPFGKLDCWCITDRCRVRVRDSQRPLLDSRPQRVNPVRAGYRG